MPNPEEQFDQLPPAIIDALRDLDGPAVLPDAGRDADVLSGARQHLAETARLSRKQRNLRLFFAGGAGGAIAAAAMIAIVVLTGTPGSNQPAASTDLAQGVFEFDQQPGDLDQSGTLDILDAYALAKQIEQGATSQAADLNADGTVDQRDIDHLAQQAVALNHEEQS